MNESEADRAEDELEQIKEFVQALAEAHRAKSPQAQQYFETVSKMAADSNAPQHYRELGSVLKKYMGGVKNPDLSGLPKELAEIVQKAIQEGNAKDEG